MIAQILYCAINISALGAFVSAAKQNNDLVGLSTKIEPIPWSKVNFLFKHTTSKVFAITKITELHPFYMTLDLCLRHGVKTGEPVLKRN